MNPTELARDAEAERKHQLVTQMVHKLNRRLKSHQRIPFILVCVDPVEVLREDPDDPQVKRRVVEQHIKVCSLRLEEPGGEHLVNALLDYLDRHKRLPVGPPKEKGHEEPASNIDG